MRTRQGRGTKPAEVRRDPLFVVAGNRTCGRCNDERRARKGCELCKGSGCEPIDLAGIWSPSPGFLVCGGPSLKSMPYHHLADRGVVSLGVNNVAGFAPVRAWCFSDPQVKFHQGCFRDAAVMTFAPHTKMSKHVRAKLPDGTFRTINFRVRDCPNSYGFARRTVFDAQTFLTDWFAHWGYGGKAGEKRPMSRLATMLLGLRLLHYLGCPRVYLLGVDLDKDSQELGNAYCFNERGSGGMRHLAKENTYLRWLRPHFEAVGFEVFNCNPKSKCDAFDYVPFDLALADCKGAVPEEPFDLADWYSKGVVREDRKKEQPEMSLSELRCVTRQMLC